MILGQRHEHYLLGAKCGIEGKVAMCGVEPYNDIIEEIEGTLRKHHSRR